MPNCVSIFNKFTYIVYHSDHEDDDYGNDVDCGYCDDDEDDDRNSLQLTCSQYCVQVTDGHLLPVN